VKNNKELEVKIVGTIPFEASVSEAEFVIFEDGKIGELSKKAQQSGLIVFKRVIKNIDAGVRMYMVYIFSRYSKTLCGMQNIEAVFPGRLQEIEKWEKLMNQYWIQIKKQAPLRNTKAILEQLETEKIKVDSFIKETKNKYQGIGKWALKKAKVLLEEENRIRSILETTFKELLKIYNFCSSGKANIEMLKKFYFEPSYCNLGNGLKTISVHFSDNPDDLKKVKEITKRMERLQEKTGLEFVEYLKEQIIDYFISIIERPIEIQVGKEKYIARGGKLRCLK